MLDGPRIAPLSGGPAKQIVVLLHGVGADGRDLIDLGHQWAPGLPDAAFVAPDGPEPCDWAPMGRQWFSLKARDAHDYWEGASHSAAALDEFLDAELAAAKLEASSLALVGFSQGTMMALHVGPRRPRPLAGILGYSGRLAGAERLAAEVKSRPPILLIHGSVDEVIPVDAMRDSAVVLRNAGFVVETIERPGLGHSIDGIGLGAGGAFLKRIFATDAA